MENGMVRFKSKREGGGRKIGEEGVLKVEKFQIMSKDPTFTHN